MKIPESDSHIKKAGDRMIKKLLNSVIAKYHDLLVLCRSILLLMPHPLALANN